MAAPKHFTAFKSKLTNKTEREHVQQNIEYKVGQKKCSKIKHAYKHSSDDG